MAEESESGQEKTEEPTEKRLKDAKDKGQVARSKELTSALLVIGGLGTLMMFLPYCAEALMDVFKIGFAFERASLQSPDSMIDGLWSSVTRMFQTLVPWFLALVAIVIFSQGCLGGISISGKAISPDLSKMNPIKGFGRMVSMNALMELEKALSKFVLVMIVAVLIVNVRSSEILSLGHQNYGDSIHHSLTIIFSTVFAVSLSLILIAMVDVPFQIHQFRKKLMMTRQELKDEMKDTEGNPEIKGRVRSMQRQIANRRMMEQVPHADVVITNPTHFSVALKYNESMVAPVVVAKGTDLMAAMIRRVGQAHEVTIVTAPPLARSIFYNAEIDQPIPTGLYVAVAQVLAYVHQLRAWRRSGGVKPNDLGSVEVPSEYQVDPVGDQDVTWDQLGDEYES